MTSNCFVRSSVAVLVLAGAAAILPGSSLAAPRFVALPEIEDNRFAPRVVYIDNPRFPRVPPGDLRKVVEAAAALVEEHFGISVEGPAYIPTVHIDDVFARLVGSEPPGFARKIGDFRSGRVDWEIVRTNLVRQIAKEKEPLASLIEFARPNLVVPLEGEDPDSFSRAVAASFAARLSHWTSATLADGHPVIGKVPGRADLPLNEYVYWALMARRGMDAEVILTNQLVASVEYIPIPIHTSIRGGITGGATEYNPSSRIDTSVWVSLFPYLSDDPQIRDLRNGDSYTRDQALLHAGTMLAHEMGHQLLQLGHPWSNEACVMRPVEALDFAAWAGKLDAGRCPIGSSPAMSPGAVKARIW